MPRRFAVLITCALVAFAGAIGSSTLVAALPGQATRLESAPVNVPVWPPPPATARIRFVRSLTPAAVQKPPSVFSRVITAIAGSGNRTAVMTQPYGVAIGPDKRLYVADTMGGRIHVYDVARRRYTAIRIEGAESLVGIAFAGRRMFVTDSASGRLFCTDLDGRVVWSRGPKDGFERPTGIAADAERAYVTDTLKHRVVIVNLDGTISGTFGERGAAPGQFNFPTNIARGADGSLYVTDSMNFRVQVFDPQRRLRRTFGQLGDGSGDFTKPKGIAVNRDGQIYVVEGFNDLVQIFDEAGRLLLAFGGSGSGDGQLWLPTGIAIDGDHIYVVDAANQRVQMFDYLRSRG